jgi:hypothetical protein
MGSNNGQGGQFERLQAYIDGAKEAQELFQASLMALKIQVEQRQQQADDKRNAAVAVATASFERAQEKLDDLYNASTRPHVDVQYRAIHSAEVARDLALAEARSTCFTLENIGLDVVAFGPEHDRFELQKEAIDAAFEVATRTAEQSLQLSVRPINALWQLASKQNKAAVRAAEKRADEVLIGKLRKISKSYDEKKDALLKDFRARREERLSIW